MSFGCHMQCRRHRFGGSEARPNGNSRAAEGEGKEDEVPLDAAMLSEEEALIVTSRLHQVRVDLGAGVLAQAMGIHGRCPRELGAC